MKTDIGFEELGKKAQFKIPDGFFETITAKTLAEAKARKKKARTRRLLYSLTTAASVTAIALSLTFLAPYSRSKNLVSQQTEKDSIKVPELVISYPLNSQKSETAKINIQSEKKLVSQTPISNEQVEDILASITDEELIRVSEMVYTEIEVDELKNNNNE